MTACFSSFFITLCLVYIAVFSSAIYDPTLITTKPPERRESVLPWHSTDNEKESRGQTTSRSSKWYQSRDPNITPKPENWSSWRKAPGSEIEQRTQIDIQANISQPVSGQISAKVPEQRNFDKLEQQESLKFPFEYGDLTESDKNYGYFKDESKYGNRGRPQNEIDFEHKHLSRNDKIKKTHMVFENEDLYEGVATDSTKPRKENILSRKSQYKVARYNSQLGVQCPDDNSTGQFVYPPDCKFFVNCWKGRAFVQPCAPGTHFNPDTLECDFPHKVKCYEDESVNFREPDSESQINRKSQKLQEPKCPPYLIGLLPHHGDCTKFVQCAHGATYIMNCGPGTVFNPAIGVCDWPRNVKGCEDIFKSEEKMPLTPPNLNSGHDKAKYIEIKKITCPADFTGLLPHPETCKKFLQCANGVTYVMDCGPGTAFNPITTVCDWPYNVPSCKTDTSDNKAHRTKNSTWIPFAGVGGTTSWSNPSRYNHTNSRGHLSRPYNTTTSPTFRPNWRPFTTSSSSPWIPTWTTSRPFYDRSQHTVNYHDGYRHGESRYQDHPDHPGRFHPEWKPSTGNVVQPSDSNYGFQDHLNRQWTENRRTDQIPRVYHSDRPEGSWSYEHRNQDHHYDHGYYPPGNHYHHHHHHYHNYGPTTNPPANPSWNSDSPSATSDRSYDQGYQGYTPNADDSQQRSDHDHHYDSDHYNHHYFGHAASSETDQRRFQSYLPPEGYNEDNIQFHNEHNETKFFGVADGNLPISQRTDHDLLPNRQDYSRTNPGLYHPNFNRTFPSAGNVFLNSGNKFAKNRNQNESRQNRLTPSWAGQENTAWNQPNGSFGFKPSTQHGQQNQEVQTEIQIRPWNQDMASQDGKRQFGNNIYKQSMIDKETDAKIAQWASKTNVLLNLKNQVNLVLI